MLPISRSHAPPTHNTARTPGISIRQAVTVACAFTGFAGRALAAPTRSQQPLLAGLDMPQQNAPIANVTFAHDAIGFAIVGDYGQAGKAEKRVANMIKAWKPSFIATTGDNNYPSGAQSTFDNNVGQYYHDFIKFDHRYKGAYALRGSKKQNFFPALGNHDWMTKKARPHVRTFDLPGNRRFYNVRRGPVEIFVVDSDPSEPEGVNRKSHQAQWLKHELKRSKATWKIVTMHHAPYSTGHHGCNTYMQWPYERWGASAVVAGHDHFYERVVMQGFPYFVNGAGGAELDKHSGDSNIPGADEDVAYDKRHGALRVQADNERIAFCFFNDQRTLIDAFLMPNNTHNDARQACESL